MAASNAKLRELALTLSANVEQYNGSNKENHARIVRQAQEIIAAVGRIPEEQMLEDTIKSGEMVSKHLFNRWGAFEAIPSEGSITLEDLATAIDCDVKLISTQIFGHL